MPVTGNRREWFTVGARSCALASLGTYDVPTYPCPICRDLFTVEALDDERLSVEHVPPESLGGKALLLTCRRCNNDAGTKLDADAKTQEEVRLAMAGKANRPHKIRASFGTLTVSGQMHASEGKFSLTIPRGINKPGAVQEAQQLGKAGTTVTVEHERYSELGANISWLRAGYLALVAMQGYSVVFDPAMDIVRQQIRECDERRLLTFVGTAQADFPPTMRSILRCLAPEWHRGWVVLFGRHMVHLPSLGDMTFYDRLAADVRHPDQQPPTYESHGWLSTPSFGLS